MCGITGSFNFVDISVLKKMLSEIHHRGPDDSGYYSVDNCMLGIQRLSILDIELGKQPMMSNDQSIVLVFNGEIFNYLELKDELKSKGVKFNTRNSDTEVILKLYEFYGKEFLSKLNGMFGIAIYDRKKKKLIIARDRVGIKNIFYAYYNKVFVFGSEIKAILKSNLVKKEPNINSIFNYFSFKNITAPETAFKNIYQVLPGEVIEISSKGICRSKYWSLKNKIIHKFDKVELREIILSTLKKSIKKQLRSDVDVGFFLSGGLDSSAVTYLSSLYAKKKIKTFTLVYEDKYNNKAEDKKFAKIISKLVGSEHYEFLITENNIFDNLNDALTSFDQPFGGVISMHYLAKEISKHVKVALSGDGADELFGSYIFPRIIKPIELLKNPSIENNKALSDYEKIIVNSNKLNEFLNLDYPTIKNKLGVFNDIQKNNIFSKNLINAKLNTIQYNRSIFERIEKNDPINEALTFEFLTLLPDQVLSFVDILSMCHSLEVRPPFLDNDMVDLAFSIHGDLKINFNEVKYILKKSLESILPKELIYRKKEGFVMPIEELFINKKFNYISEVLAKRNLAKHDLLDYENVSNILTHYDSNDFKAGQQIWLIYCFQVWWDRFF